MTKAVAPVLKVGVTLTAEEAALVKARFEALWVGAVRAELAILKLDDDVRLVFPELRPIAERRIWAALGRKTLTHGPLWRKLVAQLRRRKGGKRC